MDNFVLENLALTNSEKLFLFGVLSVYVAFLSISWWFNGRNAAKVLGTHQNTPPFNWSPVVLSYFIQQGNTVTTITTLIFSLALKGKIRIAKLSRFEITPNSRTPSDLEEENSFLDAVFTRSERIVVSKRYNSRLVLASEKCISNIRSQVNLDEYFVANTLYKVLAVVLTIITYGSLIFIFRSYITPLYAIGVGYITVFAILVAYIFYSDTPLISVVMLGGVILIPQWLRGTGEEAVYRGVAVVLGIMLWVYMKNMTRITQSGQTAIAKIERFEKHLLQKPLPQLVSASHYSDMFCYAVALGIHTKWLALNSQHDFYRALDFGIDNLNYFFSDFRKTLKHSFTRPNKD